eukprot:1158187-Pelagomonas_calceolata.AAC.2
MRLECRNACDAKAGWWEAQTAQSWQSKAGAFLLGAGHPCPFSHPPRPSPHASHPQMIQSAC